MKDIKPGALMFVKISSEQGMVMATRMSGNPDFPGFIVELKLPKQSHEDGIKYVVQDFYEQELETAQARFDREYKDMFDMHKNMTPSPSNEVLELLSTTD